MGLESGDLFPEKPRAREGGGTGVPVAVYSYEDAGGDLLYQAVRFSGKKFRQRRPDGKGEYAWNMKDVRRVPYRLPELIKARETNETIYLAEGEKDVDNLRKLGLAATCNVGGASKWLQSYNTFFEGACVVILPDNDTAGEKHAAEVASALHPVASNVKMLELPGLEEKGDVSDWIAAGGTREELAHLADSAEVYTPGKIEWSPPMRLAKHDLPPFPDEVLPEPLRAYVGAVARTTQTPVDMAAMLSLSLLGAIFARKFVANVKPDWSEPLNLYTVTALAPGNRKSAVVARLTAPIDSFEKSENERLQPTIDELDCRRKILEQSIESAQKLASKAKQPIEREASIANAVDLRQELAALETVSAVRILADDHTPEALTSLMAKNGERIAVLSSEGGVFDTMAGRYTKNGPTLEVYLKAHAGDAIRVDRKGRAPEFIEKPALTMGLTVQPEVIQRLGAREGFRGLGLLARFLYCMPHSTVGYRDPDPDDIPAQVKQECKDWIGSLLQKTSSLEEAREPILVSLDNDALRQLNEFSMWLEPRLGPGGELDTIADWASKLSGAVVRIAALTHLASLTDFTRAIPPVSGAGMRDSISTGRYLIKHALAAFSQMELDPKTIASDHVLNSIRRHGLNEFSAKELFEKVKGRCSSNNMEKLQPLLQCLAEHNYIRRVERERRPGPGQPPSPRWEVNPHIHSHNSHKGGKTRGNGNSADSADSADSFGATQKPVPGVTVVSPTKVIL